MTLADLKGDDQRLERHCCPHLRSGHVARNPAEKISSVGRMNMDEISFRSSAPWWRVVAWVVTVVVLAASYLTAVSTSAQAANLEQHNPATYNMQGASADTTPKWSSDIPSLLIHDVIALHAPGPVL